MTMRSSHCLLLFALLWVSASTRSLRSDQNEDLDEGYRFEQRLPTSPWFRYTGNAGQVFEHNKDPIPSTDEPYIRYQTSKIMDHQDVHVDEDHDEDDEGDLSSEESSEEEEESSEEVSSEEESSEETEDEPEEEDQRVYKVPQTRQGRPRFGQHKVRGGWGRWRGRYRPRTTTTTTTPAPAPEEEEMGNYLEYVGHRRMDNGCPEGQVQDIYGYCRGSFYEQNRDWDWWSNIRNYILSSYQ